MGYVPEDAEWFLAEIVEEITVEDDPRNVVHTNRVLVRADSAEEAYEKAVALGADGETSYENPAGKQVTIRFRGLHDLNVIHDRLEHGAELIFSERIGMAESEIQKWVSPKPDLGVFAPITRSDGPNYAARDVLEEVFRRFPQLKSDHGTDD